MSTDKHQASEQRSAKPASGPRTISSPRILPESAAYWQAANDGRLLLKKCADCAEVHFYPRDICPQCLSDRTEWFEAAGTGTVYSFSTMGKGAAAYTLAYVTLDEGVSMLTNLVDCEPDTLAINQRVKAVFKPAEGGQAVVMFTPA